MPQELERSYRAYIDLLNERSFDELDRFVHERMTYNGEDWTLEHYRGLLQQDVRTIPDLRYEIRDLVVDERQVAAGLRFVCHPRGTFLGQQTDGRLLEFAEHVFYRFEGGRIADVRSLIDVAAIRRQLEAPPR